MKTLTLTPHGRYVLVTFPLPDDATHAALKAMPSVHWKPTQGGWVVEVRHVVGLSAHLREKGYLVRYGAPVVPEKPKAAFVKPAPPPPRPQAQIDPEFLRSIFFRPGDVGTAGFQNAYVARWKAPESGLPALEPVDLAALDTDFAVPGFKGELYGFQRQGVAFLRKLGWNGIVADEMGLGKTIQAIAAALLAGERTLVVCPAAVKYNWLAEIRRFSDATAAVLNGTSLDEGPSDAFFVVANYDVLRRNVERLNAAGFGLVVLDEAHYVKNPRTSRAQSAYALNMTKRILLTGTPLLNRPEELWPLLNFVQPGKWGKESDFRARFTRRVNRLAVLGGSVTGAPGERLAELRDRLRGVMIRRQKSVVLKELPPKRIEVQPVELPEDAKQTYEALEKDLAEHLAREGLEGAFRAHTWLRTLAKMHALKQFLIAERLPAAARWLAAKAAEGEKIVVFSQYLTPLHTLAREMGEHALLIDGSVPSWERLERVNVFQSDPAKEVLVGQIQAAGTGLNLTAARTVLFLDLAWTPAAHAQATDRCHRIGQTREVQVTFLVTPGTIDDDLQEILLEKQAVINTVMGEKQQVLSEATVMKRVAERLMRARG